MCRIDWRNWKPPRAEFCMWGYFWPGSDKFESWKRFKPLTKLWRNCHIFESVKNHINAYNLHTL